MSKFQLKIMAALTLLVIVVVAASGFLAERGLRERTTSKIRENLEREATLIGHLMADVGFRDADQSRLWSVVHLASAATGARVTLIDSIGRVLADSEVPENEIQDLPNHADRPEIISAAGDRAGHSIRRSDTLKRDLMYVALRVDENAVGSGRGFVRLAIDLDQVDSAAAGLRRQLIVAGFFGLLVALGLSYGLSLLSLRPITELREVVAEIAEGKLERRLRWETHDERGEIAVSINRLARQLRDSADQANREKERLEAVLSSMVEGVIVIDSEGKVLLVNPRAQEMLSIWGTFKDRTVPEVIRSPEVDQALQDAAVSNVTVVRELTVRAEKERVLLMHAAAFPTVQARAGTVAVFHDVSELRRVDRMRRDFIANASHELRTPLTSIQGFADALGNSDLAADQVSEYLKVIVRNTRRMSSLIDDLLTLSRIESGASLITLREVDAARVIENVIAEFAPRFAEAGIEVTSHLGKVPLCRADRAALEQILGNLLSNAARYSNAGSRVDVFLELNKGRVEIRVEDTGIGIPAADLERIFERFYRVDAARSRALGSTGLGLAIVKHLARSMGSDIRVESEVGQGSRFHFDLAPV